MLALALVGCRAHTLDDGPYAVTVDQVLRDDCGLAGTEVIGTATLVTQGHQVALTLAKPDLTMLGTYKYGLEQITLDGSLSNQREVLAGRECLLDLVTLHADTVTTDPTHFTGSMSIAYETKQADACTCRFWFNFKAAAN
ncbi:MAG: hypothetical protein U0228_14695 [Myxococcaceae bacterium]